jgi:Flp pilus assembly protein CpaB
MKNFVPLILAVLLGLAAVLAVGRLLKQRELAEEQVSSVVAAARDIEAGTVLTDNAIMLKKVPVSARPAQAIPWTRKDMVVGQKAKRSIANGDYLLLPDVGLSSSMADIVGQGEWAVTLRIDSGGIGKIVQAGDEVAVIGTFKVDVQVATADLSAAPEERSQEATVVLFPRVRVLDVLQKSDKRGAQEQDAEIIVALPPQQAQVLIAAQRKASLTLALRRTSDDTAISRIDAGMVDDKTFVDMLNNLKSVELPETPGIILKSGE